jgi:hypothetical protein
MQAVENVVQFGLTSCKYSNTDFVELASDPKCVFPRSKVMKALDMPEPKNWTLNFALCEHWLAENFQISVYRSYALTPRASRNSHKGDVKSLSLYREHRAAELPC